MILRYFLTLCALIGFASASAQSALNLPVKVLNGDSYYYYQVKKPRRGFPNCVKSFVLFQFGCDKTATL